MTPPVPIDPFVLSVSNHATDPRARPQTAAPEGDGLLDGEEHVLSTVALEEAGDDDKPFAPRTFRKIGWGMAVLVALVVAPYLAPELDASIARATGVCAEGKSEDDDCSFARAWLPGEPVPFWNVIGRELLGEGTQEEAVAEEVAQAEALAVELLAIEETEVAPVPDKPIIAAPPPDVPAALPVYIPHADDAQQIVLSLEMPSPEALDSFFESLAQSEAGYEGAITRVTQWGDSVMAADNVTSSLRLSMQRRFGDAGHGFHLLAKPNNSYRHLGIRATSSGWSLCYIINKCKSDGHFGLGGTTVSSSGGASSTFKTAADGAVGRQWSRAELWYAAQPNGGPVRLQLDRGDAGTIDTSGDALEDRWHTLTMDDGPHALTLRAGGRARLYGVVFERDVPGVVWDGMEQLGAFTSRMLYFDPEHLRGQVEHRDPKLLVFMFGGNDLMLSGPRLEQYAQTWTDVLERFRGPEGEPRRACLIIAPVDHGKRDGPRIVSVPEMRAVVAAQRAAAKAAGCAFFDTPTAMGGEGSAGRWRQGDKPLIAGDLSHLTNAGQKVIGHYVYLALMEQYVAYRGRIVAASAVR